MTGTAFEALKIKEIVTDASDNEVLGYAAGIATILLGAVITNEINQGVDKAFEPIPIVIEGIDDFEIEFDELENEEEELIE